jgi:hypothetical protein
MKKTLNRAKRMAKKRKKRAIKASIKKRSKAIRERNALRKQNSAAASTT